MYFSPALLARLALFCLLLTLPAAARATSSQYAPIMPRASQALLLDVTLAGTRLLAVGEHGIILYSDDSGATWQQARVPTTQMLTSVYFIDPQRGWAAGHDGLILVSDDAGVNWRIQRDGIAAQQQANLEQREVAHDTVARLEQALAAADPADRAELQTELDDARLDLEDADDALDEPAFASPLMDIWFQDRERGWAVGAFGTLLATRDGGKHWGSQSDLLDNPDGFHLNTVTGDGAGRVFVAGEGGVMFRSPDGGATWETLEPFYEGSWFGAVYSPVGQVLLVFGLRGHLYRSEDFGNQWEPVTDDNTMTLAGGSPADNGDIVLVGGVGTVLRSRDGGRSFALSMLPDRLGLSAAVQRGDQLILVGQGGVKRLPVGAGHD